MFLHSDHFQQQIKHYIYIYIYFSIREFLMDNSDRDCYFAVIRPSIKATKHCATGQTEIQRVCQENDHNGLEFSIKHSVMLKKYKEQYPYTEPFTPLHGEALCENKVINHEQRKFYVVKVLRQLHSFEFAQNTIEKLTKVPYNRNESSHEQMLGELWKNFKPDQQLESRISEDWISLGFQGKDPATDFRGAGYLGLLNLHRLSQTKLGKAVFRVASDPKSEYFFASTGIFFSMLAFTFIKQKKLAFDYWVNSSEQEVLILFQQIYTMLFHEFTDFWLNKCTDKSIMAFNVNLKVFQKNILSQTQQQLKIRIFQIHNL